MIQDKKNNSKKKDLVNGSPSPAKNKSIRNIMTQDKINAREKNAESVEIQDSGSLHHYRTEIPNIIFKMNLDPWAFKAYCVFKMTTGDRGVCFKSNVTLSEEIGCSIPTLIKLKHQLEEEGLIKIIKRIHKNGGNMPDLIQIVDIWPQNMQMMSNLYPPNPKNDLKMLKKRDPNNFYGDKGDLRGGVNAVNEGSKRRLHKQDLKEQEQKEQEHKNNNNNKTQQPKNSIPVKPKSDVVVVVSENSKDLSYKNSKGISCLISQSDIFRHFVSLPYSTAIVQKAIEQARQSSELINNILRYLEGICENLSKQKIKVEPKKKKECSVPDTSHRPRDPLGGIKIMKALEEGLRDAEKRMAI